MATTRIMKVHAVPSKRALDTFACSLKYVLNEQKTKTNPQPIKPSKPSKPSKPKSNEATITETLDYAINETKAQHHVSAYGCDPAHAAQQFAQNLSEYLDTTGRQLKADSVLLYHIRQAFKPGEVDPTTANEIGHQLALAFTHGDHAFVVATHTDKHHIHNHIIVDAVNLHGNGKFRETLQNGTMDLAPLSDKLCAAYGLSVIEQDDPTRFRGNSIPHWKWQQKQGITTKLTKRQQLEDVIYTCLEKQPESLAQLFEYMKAFGCVAKKRSKGYSIMTPFAERGITLASLSTGYTQEDLVAYIQAMNTPTPSTSISSHETLHDDQAPSTNKTQTPKPQASKPKKPFDMMERLLRDEAVKQIIDIEHSLKANESVGYKRWAERHNLEQMSKMLLLLEKHDLTFADIEAHHHNKQNQLTQNQQTINRLSQDIDTIKTLQRHIGSHTKGRDIYRKYTNASQLDKVAIRLEHDAVLTKYEQATAYFEQQGYGTGDGKQPLPKYKALQQDYARLSAERQSIRKAQYSLKRNDTTFDTVFANMQILFGPSHNEHAQVQTQPDAIASQQPTHEHTTKKSPSDPIL